MSSPHRPHLTPEDLTIFHKVGWLSRQPGDFRRQILHAGRAVTLARGSTVYNRGDPPGGIYGIVSGAVGIDVSTERLAPRLGHIHRQGNWFGHGPALDGGRRSMGFRITEDCVLLHVELTNLREIVATIPNGGLMLGALANEGVNLATRAACELMIRDTKRRVAAIVLRLCAADIFPDGQTVSEIQISQTDVGEMANASRHSVLRAFMQFEEAGWIAQRYNHIRLVDVPALQAYAYSDT